MKESMLKRTGWKMRAVAAVSSLAFGLALAAQAGTVTIAASGQGAVGTIGNTLTVTLNYDATTGITSTPFRIDYDKSKITIPNTAGTPTTWALGAGVANGVGTGLTVDESGATGQLWVDFSDLTAVVGNGATFNGTLFTVQVSVPGAATSGLTALTFTQTGDFSEGLGTATVNFTASNFLILKYYNAITDTPTVLEDTPTVVNVLANDTNELGTVVTGATITKVNGSSTSPTATTHGSVTWTSTTLTYTPAPNYAGADSFTYTGSYNHPVQTGTNPQTDTGTVNVTVTNVNDAPAGTNNTVTTLEDTACTFTAANFGFTDPNDTPANNFSSVKITTLPALGTLKLNGTAMTVGAFATKAQIDANQLTYEPVANANGTPYTTFTFQVKDDGGTANGGVDLDQSPNTITINVTAVNDAPAGTNTTVTGLEDTAYVFTAANFGFTDPNDSPANAFLSVKITTLPGAGTLSLAARAAVNAGDFVLKTDIDAGKLTFTAAANASGTPYTTFTFQVRDNGGTTNGGVDLDQSPNTMTINVTAVNDAPAGTDNTVTTAEDTAYVFTAANFGFTDPNDSPANAFLSVKITTLPGAGTLKLNGTAMSAGAFATKVQIDANQLTYEPAADGNGSPYATFTFQVKDDGGTTNGGVDLDPSANTMTVNVTAVNDAPRITSATITPAVDLVNGGLITVTVIATDVEAGNGDGITYKFVWTSGADSIKPDVDAGPSATATDTWTATKPHGTFGDNYPVTVTVTLYDPQEPANATVQTVTVKQTYVGNEPPVVSASSPASPQNINEGASVNFSATFTDAGHSPQDDGIKSIVWTVAGLTKTGKTTNYTPTYTSPKTDTFTLSTNNNDVTHAEGVKAATVTATATDGMNVTAQQTWAINVKDVNTAPGLGTTTIAITKDGGTGLLGAPGKEDTLTATVTPGATDADTEDVATLRYRVVWTDNTITRALLKSVDLPVGVYTTTLTKAEHAAVRGRVITATVYALDSQNAVSPTSTADNITIANTAPVGVDDTGTTTEDETLVFNQTPIRAVAGLVLNNDTDVDGDVLSVSAVDAASNMGAVVTRAGNVITYDPRNAQQCQALQVGGTAADTFNYTLSDGFGGSDTATVTVTVNGANDKPYWPENADIDGESVNDGDNTKQYTATVTGTPADVDWDDVFWLDGRNGTTLKIFYMWTNLIDDTVVYMDGSTVLVGFEPFDNIRISLFGQIPNGQFRTSVMDNVPKSETWRCEAYIIDQRDAISETPLRTFFGTPQWYPYIDLGDFDPTPAGFYKVEIRTAAGGLVVTMHIRDKDAVQPQDYINAKNQGLAPGVYSVRVLKFNPVTGAFAQVGVDQELPVENYGVATATIPETYDFDAGRALGPNPRLKDGNYDFAFTVENAAGYEMVITMPNGTTRTFRDIFRPDSEGVVTPDNVVEKLQIYLGQTGNYTWTARGFNPNGDGVAANAAFAIAAEDDQDPNAPPANQVNANSMQPGLPDPRSAVLGTAIDGSLPVTFSWGAVDGTRTYYLFLMTAGGTVILNQKPVVGVTTYGPVTLPPGQYVWYVIATNALGVGTWSNAVNFSIKPELDSQVPAILNVVAAVNRGANPANVTFTITWDVVGTQQQVWIYNSVTGAAFTHTSNVTLVAGRAAGTSDAVVTDSRALSAGVTYYFQARGSNGANVGPWTVTGLYTVPAGAQDAPGKPTVTINENRTVATVTFTGVAPDTVQSQALVYANGVSTPVDIDNANGGGAVNVALPAALRVAGTTAYYRARGVNGDTVGPWSDWKYWTNTEQAP